MVKRREVGRTVKVERKWRWGEQWIKNPNNHNFNTCGKGGEGRGEAEL